MSLIIYTHPSSHRHVTPPGHPERVARIEAIDVVLGLPEFAGIDRAEAPAATDEPLLRAHSEAHLEKIVSSAPGDGWVSLDPDTHMSPGSLDAARHGAGANVAAVEKVMSGAAKAAFCC